MRILTANLLAILSLAFCAPAALAQGMTGAGGAGGAGGGADANRRVVVRDTDRSPPCVTREPAAPGSMSREPLSRDRLSRAPALDPSRRVNVVSCTQPFDPLSKGNLCCI